MEFILIKAILGLSAIVMGIVIALRGDFIGKSTPFYRNAEQEAARRNPTHKYKR